MKVVFFFAMLAIASVFSAPPAAFTISGSIAGAPDGKKVYLKYADISKAIIDSAVIRNGKFSFSGKAGSPRFMSVVVAEPAVAGRAPQHKAFSFFVENAEIEVSALYDSLKMEYEMYGGRLTSPGVQVKGSSSHDQFLRFYNTKSAMDEQRSALFSDYIDFLNPKKDEKKKPREVGISLTQQMDEVELKRKQYVLNYILNKPPSEVAAFMAKQAVGLASITTEEISSLLAHFEKLKEKGVLAEDFQKAALLARKTAVGAPLLNFSLTDLEGGSHALSEYIKPGNGKYTLLEFWASWCGPCRADIPHLRDVHALYKSKGFDIVSISLDEKKADWLKAVEQEDLKGRWTQLQDEKAFKGELAENYRINGIPACLLFDPNGKLVTRNMRGSWMDAKLIQLYGNLFKAEH